jgi:hypothetical protein
MGLTVACATAAILTVGSAAPAFPLPPLGYNSWYQFDIHINESLVRATADAFVRLGLDKVRATWLSSIVKLP